MKSSAPSAEAPFAAGGGLAGRHAGDDDPYRALDDLMAAVEALCREWPRRGHFRTAGKMLL